MAYIDGYGVETHRRYRDMNKSITLMKSGFIVILRKLQIYNNNYKFCPQEIYDWIYHYEKDFK